MDFLSRILAAAAAFLAGCAATNPALPTRVEGYELVAKYAVGGAGGWDYPSIDEARHRLYVSRGDRVQVIDTRTGRAVGELAGTAGVHGIAFADDLGVGFTSNGRSDSVTVFDLDTLVVVESVKVTGANPDAILYEPVSKRIFTFNGRSANVTAIDARSRKVAGTVAVSGKPEFAVANGRGEVFVNIEDKNALAVFDAATLAPPRYWPLGNCEEPTGLAIDARRGLLFSVCHNRKMIVMDAHDGKIVKELPIGASVDGAAFDPALDLAFSANGDGTVTVVRCVEPDRCAVVSTVDTQKGARTIALDSTTHRIYLPTASFTPAAATPEQPRPRPTMVPDSFVILVLAPR